MRLPTPPSETIIRFAAPYASFFPGVSWSYFIAFMTMVCQGVGRRTVTQAQRTAPFKRDYAQHSRFLEEHELDEQAFRDTSLDQLRAAGATTKLGDGRRVMVTATDDALVRRPWGPHLFGTQTHHDHAAAAHQSTYCRGQRYVVFGLVPDALDDNGVRCTMVDVELYVSRQQAGEETVEFETKPELAALMTKRLREYLERRGAEETITLDLVDAWYLKSPYLRAMRRHENSHVLGRLQINRALYCLPEPKPPGKPGPAPKKGPKWDWRKALAEEGEVVTQYHYGQKRRIRYVAREVKINGYEESVLVIAAQYVDRHDSKPVLFLTTLLDLDPEEAIQLYAARFSLEETIRDMKHKLGFGTEMVRTRQRWQSYKRYMLLAHQFLRHLADHASETLRQKVRDPWRDEQPRLTVGLVQQALRYESFSGETIFDHQGPPLTSGEFAALWSRAMEPQPKRSRKTS